MSQESLSALFDGECSAEELDALLDALESAPELKQQWSRMCVVHEARAGTRLRSGQTDICAAVMAGITAEPIPAASPRVVALPPRHRRGLSWRPMLGFALAASVAAVAVTLGINFGTVRAPGAADTVDAAGAQAVAYESGARIVDEDLRGYLLEHSNTLADRGVGGALSYARFAARTADEAFAQPASLAVDSGMQQ